MKGMVGMDDLLMKKEGGRGPDYVQERTERVGSDSGEKVARFFFLEKRRNTTLRGKTVEENMQFQATFPS